jgi:hypothetical protein
MAVLADFNIVPVKALLEDIFFGGWEWGQGEEPPFRRGDRD